MMRKTITRTLTRATISGYTVVMENGAPKVEALEPVTAWGSLTDVEAKKVLTSVHGDKAIVGEVKYTDEAYKISIDDFVAHAVKVENKQESDQ